MSERSSLAARLEALGRAKVLVVGDLMLDHFVKGEVERISPEAPVPVLQVSEETDLLGRRQRRAQSRRAGGGNPFRRGRRQRPGRQDGDRAGG